MVPSTPTCSCYRRCMPRLGDSSYSQTGALIWHHDLSKKSQKVWDTSCVVPAMPAAAASGMRMSWLKKTFSHRQVR